MKRIIAIFLSLCMAFTCCTGCVSNEGYRYTVADTFDTVIEIICYTSQKDADRYGKQAQKILKHWHKLSDAYNDWSGVRGIYAINHADGQWVEIDEDLSALLRFGKEAYEQTEGVVNMMGGAVTSLWKDTETPPTPQAVAEGQKHIGIDLLELEEGRVRLLDAAARIDVGAFAKGYALQKTAEALKKEGFCGILSAISSVVTVGDKNGEPFAVGVGDQKGGVAEVLKMKDIALSTSGTDQRYFVYKEKEYHHIIDLSLGKPADSGITQASVMHGDAAWADVYSTAALIRGQTERSAILRKADGSVRYCGEIEKWK